MPRMDGLGLLSGLVSELDRLAVVMVTAKGSIGTAVEAPGIFSVMELIAPPYITP